MPAPIGAGATHKGLNIMTLSEEFRHVKALNAWKWNTGGQKRWTRATLKRMARRWHKNKAF
jgi:hypothetical protein